MADEGLRWEVGEALHKEALFLPFVFYWIWGGVIAWKWSARAARRCFARPASLLRLPPPLLALPPPCVEERLPPVL
jgi:hypothetical protein